MLRTRKISSGEPRTMSKPTDNNEPSAASAGSPIGPLLLMLSLLLKCSPRELQNRLTSSEIAAWAAYMDADR